MPRSTVHDIIHRVTEDVVAILHQVMHLPKTPEEMEVVSRGIGGLAHHRAFRKAVGAIDGCHIWIKAPSGPDGQCYRNRKLFPSIILQAVCDHQACFIDAYVGWPGSVHDSRVLRHSPLHRQSAYPPHGHFILADGGHPCLQHPLPLITLYKWVVQQPSFQGTLHHRACFWNDEGQVQGHLPESAGGAPHLCTSCNGKWSVFDIAPSRVLEPLKALYNTTSHSHTFTHWWG
ncbi:putative nuclease HARBI1 [Nothobranchius furzeri]|uniref:putative nuclease HARBI1 n=1 Tax=Nothobranchius furzeri TaxID=105023 RepID=UPI0039046CD4